MVSRTLRMNTWNEESNKRHKTITVDEYQIRDICSRNGEPNKRDTDYEEPTKGYKTHIEDVYQIIDICMYRE